MFSTSMIVHGDVFSPPCMHANNKRTNPAELLRLYITFDLLEPAIALAMEYIDAVLVDGRAAFFGVKVSVQHACAWFMPQCKVLCWLGLRVL